MPPSSFHPIRAMFARVPRTYDRVNRLLTFGLDVLWRRRAARIATRGGGTMWLDSCAGTGDMTGLLSGAAPTGVTVHAVDFCPEMLAEARGKLTGRPVRFLLADARALPLPDGSMDLVTMAFATRNLNRAPGALLAVFREYHRVLRPGGRFVTVETSRPRNRLIRFFYHVFLRMWVEPVGAFVSGERSPYAYLAHSMSCFYGAADLARILREAGFGSVRYRRLFFGVAAIHVARKS